MFGATVPRKEAASNLKTWLTLIGIENIPIWLSDNRARVVGGVLIVMGILGFIYSWARNRNSRNSKEKVSKNKERLDIVFDPNDSSCVVNKIDFINRRPPGDVIYGPPINHKEYRVKIHNPHPNKDAHKVIVRLETIVPYNHAYNQAPLHFLHDNSKDRLDSHNGITIPAGGSNYVKVAGVSDYDEYGKEQIRIYFADPISPLIEATKGYELHISVCGDGFSLSQERFFVQRNPKTHEPEFREL